MTARALVSLALWLATLPAWAQDAAPPDPGLTIVRAADAPEPEPEAGQEPGPGVTPEPGDDEAAAAADLGTGPAEPEAAVEAAGSAREPTSAGRAFPLGGIVLVSLAIPLRRNHDGMLPVSGAVDAGFSVLIGSSATLEVTAGYMGFELGPNTGDAWVHYVPVSVGFRVFPLDPGTGRARGSHGGLTERASFYFGLSVGGGSFWEAGGAPQHRGDAIAARVFEAIDGGSTRGGTAHAVLVLGFETNFGGRWGLRVESRTTWFPLVSFAAPLVFAPAEPAWVEGIALGMFF